MLNEGFSLDDWSEKSDTEEFLLSPSIGTRELAEPTLWTRFEAAEFSRDGWRGIRLTVFIV
jgi:hypothetical protein